MHTVQSQVIVICSEHTMLVLQCGVNTFRCNMTLTELLVTSFAMFEGTAVPSSIFAWMRTAHTGSSLGAESHMVHKPSKLPMQEQCWEASTEAVGHC